MRIKPPAGKKITETHVKLKTLEEIAKKLKGKCTLIKFSGEGNGWIILNRKKIVAAYFRGMEEHYGLRAIADVERMLRDGCRVSFFEITEKILPVFTGMYPEIAINEDTKSASFGARIHSDTEEAMISVNHTQFTEERELEVQAENTDITPPEKKEEVREETQKEEETEKMETAGVEVRGELLDSLRTALTEKEITKERIPKETNVVNFQSFLDTLAAEKFSGIVRGYDGSIEMTIYMKNGEISAATVKDGDIEIKGNPALFYLETPARVFVEEKPAEDVVFPEDAACGVDEDARSKLYRSLQ